MNAVATALLVFAFLAGVSVLVLLLHPRLPPAHRSKETTDIIRLGIGVVATVAALILALLISSVKGSFDEVNHGVQHFASGLILTDRALRFYGPGAEPARALLIQYTERALGETWPDDKSKAIVQDPVAGALLDQTEAAILALQSEGRKPIQAAQAAEAIHEVVRDRWGLVEERGSAVSPTLMIALALWLGLIFASFGYNAPRNAAVLMILLLCAASVAGAVFMVVEMDGPFTGLMTVPSDPVKRALAHMQ